MSISTLEQRVSELERKVDRLLSGRQEDKCPWWERHLGAFKDDPDFEEAMRLGEEYRKSQPNPADNPDAITF